MGKTNKLNLKAKLALSLLGAVLLAALLFTLLLLREHTLIGGWAVDRNETVLDCRDLSLHSTLGLRRLYAPEELDLRGSELRLRSVQRMRQSGKRWRSRCTDRSRSSLPRRSSSSGA